MFDPIKVCNHHNILLIAEDLGNVCGFYCKAFEQPTIHVNVNCTKEEQRFAIQYLLENGFLLNPERMKFLRCEQLEQY